jgi:DnaJ-domain-containing protein 1
MMGQSYEERRFWQAMEERRATVAQEPRQAAQSWPLGEEVRQILGDDVQADPLFFEESWTLGPAAAAKNQQRRREEQAARARERHRIFESLGTQFVVQRWEAEPVVAPENDVDERFSAQTEANLGWDRFTATRSTNETTEMTMPLACKLLGVSTASTREEVRSAYRRMVTQWHPDRLAKSSEETRRLANEQMVAINQAYRMLREGLMQKAA